MPLGDYCSLILADNLFHHVIPDIFVLYGRQFLELKLSIALSLGSVAFKISFLMRSGFSIALPLRSVAFHRSFFCFCLVLFFHSFLSSHQLSLAVDAPSLSIASFTSISPVSFISVFSELLALQLLIS